MSQKNILLKHLSLLFIVLLFNVNVLAEQNDNSVQSETFLQWKRDFHQIARKKGISDSFLKRIVPKLQYLSHVLDSDQKQSEFLLTFWDYTDRTLTQKRIQDGIKMSKKYKTLSKNTAEKYGVPAEFLLAFWGLETNYGTFKGEIDTLNALATLAYDKRRRSFFTNELITLLKLIEKGETTRFKGSWAGAFGNFQFMPTTYAAYAVDADSDGRRDVIYSLHDAFASAGNYLSKMGWNNQYGWGYEVQITKPLNWKSIPENNKMTVAEWEKRGVLPACEEKRPVSEQNLTAKLVLPTGIDGPAFLTYSNYDLIMRWNNSTLYALTVGALSDRISGKSTQFCTSRKDVKISRDDMKFIQTRLIEHKLYAGTVDGILGKNTRNAIRLYQQKNGLDVDGYPSAQLIQLLKGK